MENPFRDIYAALFDLDGTLIETHIDFAQMKRETLTLVGTYGLKAAELAFLDILSIVETARTRLADNGYAVESARLREEAFALLEEIETAQCANPVEIPGAWELLHRLRESGVRIGVVTRNCRVVSERLLATGNLSVDVLLTRDDVRRTKPDPEHLTTALENLAMGGEHPIGTGRCVPSGPRAAVMIGDHWMDVQAGRAAGLRTVGLLRGRSAGFFTPAPPDLLVDDLRALIALTGAP